MYYEICMRSCCIGGIYEKKYKKNSYCYSSNDSNWGCKKSPLIEKSL